MQRAAVAHAEIGEGGTEGADEFRRRLGIDRGADDVAGLAARSGVAVSTIHFYEAKGLIAGWRSSGNQRRYARDVLRGVAVIKVAQRLGLPLSTIKQAIDSLPGGRTPTAKDWKTLSAAWRKELDRRIDLLQKLRGELDGCIGCGCLSLMACRLRNPEDALSAEGAGPLLLEPKASTG